MLHAAPSPHCTVQTLPSHPVSCGRVSRYAADSSRLSVLTDRAERRRPRHSTHPPRPSHRDLHSDFFVMSSSQTSHCAFWSPPCGCSQVWRKAQRCPPSRPRRLRRLSTEHRVRAQRGRERSKSRKTYHAERCAPTCSRRLRDCDLAGAVRRVRYLVTCRGRSRPKPQWQESRRAPRVLPPVRAPAPAAAQHLRRHPVPPVGFRTLRPSGSPPLAASSGQE